MAPPPPPFYPEADEKDREARTNAVATAITRLARILGLGKDQVQAESLGEGSPSIPIGGADEESYVLLDKPSEDPPVRTPNARRRSRRRSIMELVPEDVRNSGGNVSSELRSALPPASVAPLVGGRGFPATPVNNSLSGFGMLFVGLAVIFAFMSIPIICHLFILRRRRVSSSEVSGGQCSEVSAASGGRGFFYYTGVPEYQTVRSVYGREVGVGMGLPRYEDDNRGWKTEKLRGGRREGRLDLWE
ncbi:hypothetical protein HOY82DRAFT_545656 [Tuber indicum]|nr:hypothetical protein HOY82DRAFT_545656 [Tuber indicum]